MLLIRTDKIAILKVEAVEFVAGGFCVHDVLVNDEGGALGVVGNALADLAANGQSETCEARAQEGAGALEALAKAKTYRTGPNLPKRSNSSSGVTLKLDWVSNESRAGKKH